MTTGSISNITTTKPTSSPNNNHGDVPAVFSNCQHSLYRSTFYQHGIALFLDTLGHGRRISNRILWKWLLVLLLTTAYQNIGYVVTGQEQQYLVRTLTGHNATVTSVAWNPDGTQLASGSIDSTIRIWNASTWQSLRTLIGHTSNVYSVAWSPDGSQLASGSEDTTIRIWNARRGEELLTLTGHTGHVYSVAWSPDGTQLASGSSDDTIRIWQANTGKSLRTLIGHTAKVYSATWSPDGTKLASGSEDNTVRIWNASTVEELLTLAGHTDWVESVAWSPDGTQLASGSWDDTIRIWQATTGALLRTLTGHTDNVYSVAWSPDGTQLGSGGGYLDNTVRIWNAGTGEELLTLTGHNSVVKSVAWSPDGTKLASGSWDNTIRIWDPALRPNPSPAPSTKPTPRPTGVPTSNPTAAPSPRPKPRPTKASTLNPTRIPSLEPTPPPSTHLNEIDTSTNSPSSTAPPAFSSDSHTLPPTESSRPSQPTDPSTIKLTGIALKLVGVDELDLDDWGVFEAVTESWCERYFAENPEETWVRDFRTTIRVTNQDVAPATSSPPTAVSNTLTYAQTIEYYVTDESAVVRADDLVTAPFVDPFKNQAYLTSLARNSTAFSATETQILTIPQLQELSTVDVGAEEPGSSGGSTGVIIGVVVGGVFVVLLSGFAVYRKKSLQKNQDQEPGPRCMQTTQRDSSGDHPALQGDSSAGPHAIQDREPSVPVVTGSNIVPITDALEPQVLQYKDQARSVIECGVAEAVAVSVAALPASIPPDPDSVDA